MSVIYWPNQINTGTTITTTGTIYNGVPFKRLASAEDLEKSSRILEKLEIPYDFLDNSVDGVELTKILMDDIKSAKLIKMLKLKAMW